jgi:hypothetical protein
MSDNRSRTLARDRQRAYRARQRVGLRHYTVVLDEILVEDGLVTIGLLPEGARRRPRGGRTLQSVPAHPGRVAERGARAMTTGTSAMFVRPGYLKLELRGGIGGPDAMGAAVISKTCGKS